jgi:phosphatidate phosphatase APP1
MEVNGKAYELTTDSQGNFNKTFEHDQLSTLKIKTLSGQTLPIVQSYPIFFPEPEKNISVITDVDDTVLISNTLTATKRIGKILFVSPHKREQIHFSKTILNTVEKNGGRIFYVSKSESNLFGLLTCYILTNGFPKGPLFLSGFKNITTLLFQKKPKTVKLAKIEHLLKQSPDKKFILLGDDTQKDIYIYTTLAKKFSGQILKIYIHQTRKKPLKMRSKETEALKGCQIPVLFFNKSSEIKKELNFINEIFKDEGDD